MEAERVVVNPDEMATGFDSFQSLVKGITRKAGCLDHTNSQEPRVMAYPNAWVSISSDRQSNISSLL
jgi:hypothetical protein